MDRKSMANDKLVLFRRLQEYRRTKGGKKGYSIVEALGHLPPHLRPHGRYQGYDDPVVREICDRRAWGPQEVSVIMAEMPSRIKKKGLKILEPEDDPCGVAWIVDIFGNVKQFERMSEEIRLLVLKGERLESHKRRLQRKYHLYPEKLARPGVPQSDRNPIVKDLWEHISDEYAKHTPEEMKLELSARELFFKKGTKRRKD